MYDDDNDDDSFLCGRRPEWPYGGVGLAGARQSSMGVSCLPGFGLFPANMDIERDRG